MFPSEPLLAATKLATLTLGSVIAVVAQRAYRRTGNRSLRALAVGFGLLATGAIAAGLLHTVLDVSIIQSQTVQSLFTAAGLAVIVHSLVVDDRVGSREVERNQGSTRGGN
ncbi:MAG: hypothetical protein ABEJ05_06990 [Haloglomus sp.]